jgi:hypothetical protein
MSESKEMLEEPTKAGIKSVGQVFTMRYNGTFYPLVYAQKRNSRISRTPAYKIKRVNKACLDEFLPLKLFQFLQQFYCRV